MITAPVSQEQLAFWKKLWEQNRSSLQPNRITGAELNAYFCKKYAPAILDDPGFREVVHDNLMQRYSDRLDYSPEMNCYLLRSDIYVGIELKTGFFHIESIHIDQCIPIYDDLFVQRGLDADDLQNYVLVGQYLELLQTHSDHQGK